MFINKLIKKNVREELEKEEMIVMSKDRRDAVYISANSILSDVGMIRLCLGSIRDKIKDGKDPWYDLAQIENSIGSVCLNVEIIKQIIN